MEDTINLNFNIPTDNEGFVLLQCPKCKEEFKLHSSNAYNSINDIYCPFCGLLSNSYLTQDIIDLENVMIQNYLGKLINDSMHKLETSTNGNFKQVNKIKSLPEKKLFDKVDTLNVVYVRCCKKYIKIKDLTKWADYYCPYCGVINDGD